VGHGLLEATPTPPRTHLGAQGEAEGPLVAGWDAVALQGGEEEGARLSLVLIKAKHILDGAAQAFLRIRLPRSEAPTQSTHARGEGVREKGRRPPPHTHTGANRPRRA
jgi:hypothetical protein